MSDFLSNLVERSLSANATVRPQPPSIFEPPSINGSAFFRGNENPELPALEEDHQESVERLSRLQSLWRSSTSAPDTQFVPTLPEAGFTSSKSTELTSASPQIQTRVDLPETAGARARPRRATADRAKEDEQRVGALRPQLSSEHPPTEPSVDKPLPHDSTKNRPHELGAKKTTEARASERDPYREPIQVCDAGANKLVPNDSTKDRPRELRARKIIEMIAPERDAHRKLIQVRDVHAVSRQAPTPRPIVLPQQPKNLAPPPAINVTIGRVEVRAVQPPPQQRAKPKAASVLSLEEYLRQRAGGGRR
jgi:hypothetical protein